MAAIDIAGMKSAFGYQPEDEEEAKPAARETGVIDVAGMKQYFSAMPAKEKPAAPMFGVQFAPEKAAKVSQAAKKFLAEQPSLGQIAAETGAGLASMADVIAGVVPMVAGTGAYAVGRALQQTPEEATKLQQAVEAPLSQPVGRLFGVTEQPGYQQSAANRLMQFVGENLEKGAGYIAQQTGLPQADVQNMINSLTFVAPQAVKGAAGAVKGGVERVAAMAPEISPEAQAAFTAAPEVAALRRGEVTPEQVAGATLTPEQALEQFRAAGGQVPPQAAGLSVGAAQANFGPRNLTGMEYAGPGGYPSLKLLQVGEGVPIPEQQVNAAMVAEVMQGKGGVRPGVVTRDENALRQEYALANMKGPDGQPLPAAITMRNQIAAEQNALADYAKQRIANTGADPNLKTPYTRGLRLNDAAYGESGLLGEIQRQKQNIYDEARAIVGDNPVDTPNIRGLLTDKQFQGELKAADLPNFIPGLQDLFDLHATQGFRGTMPNSIASLEQLRKSVNARRDSKNSYFIGQLIQAIDDDIASAGGPGLYQRGREIHRAEKVLFEPKGMQKIFGKISENDIKAGVPPEKMMEALNALPIDEWRHIYDTFDSVSKGRMPGNLQGLEVTPELQAYAKSVTNEMKGSLARDIYESGAGNVGEWSAVKAKKELNAYDEKIQHAFDPSEVEAFHTLNAVGQLMPAASPYKGAAIQAMEVGAASPITQAAQMGVKGLSALTTAKAGGLPVGYYLFEQPMEKLSARKVRKLAQEQNTRLQEMLEMTRKYPSMTPEQIQKLYSGKK